MPLFQVQDNDCPMFVVAADWAEAIAKWRAKHDADYDGVATKENWNPLGIHHICDDNELIL